MHTLELKEGRCSQCKKKAFIGKGGICLKCAVKNIKKELQNG